MSGQGYLGGASPPSDPPPSQAGGRRSRAGGLSCEITATLKYNVVVHNNVVGYTNNVVVLGNNDVVHIKII